MTKKPAQSKPGPDAERLKIEGDPEEALQKLLETPPKKTQDDPEGTAVEEPEEG